MKKLTKSGYYKIRTWDDMLEQYGIDSSGLIDCNEQFSFYMEGEMPEDRIIFIKVNNIGIGRGLKGDWIFSDDMIEQYMGDDYGN